jgi:hypothetical protein
MATFGYELPIPSPHPYGRLAILKRTFASVNLKGRCGSLLVIRFADVHGPLPEVPFSPERRPRSIYVSLHARARDSVQKSNRPVFWADYATLPLVKLRSFPRKQSGITLTAYQPR